MGLSAYLLEGNKGRYVGGSIVGDNWSKTGFHTIGEFAFPPLGFILSEDGWFPKIELINITHFFARRYDEEIEIEIDWPRHVNPNMLPLDMGKEAGIQFRVLGGGTDFIVDDN